MQNSGVCGCEDGLERSFGKECPCEEGCPKKRVGSGRLDRLDWSQSCTAPGTVTLVVEQFMTMKMTPWELEVLVWCFCEGVRLKGKESKSLSTLSQVGPPR